MTKIKVTDYFYNLLGKAQTAGHEIDGVKWHYRRNSATVHIIANRISGRARSVDPKYT